MSVRKLLYVPAVMFRLRFSVFMLQLQNLIRGAALTAQTALYSNPFTDYWYSSCYFKVEIIAGKPAKQPSCYQCSVSALHIIDNAFRYSGNVYERIYMNSNPDSEKYMFPNCAR